MLRCLNCNKEVPESEACFFGGGGSGDATIFVCPACYQMAENFYQRGQRELERMIFLLKESIRVALIEGRLHFGEGNPQDISKADLLKEIVKMEAARNDAHSSS